MSVIKLENVTKYYGKNKGIENLTLEVDEGDVFGFIGPNGAGKSTTIRLLMNFIFPTGGNIEILGKNVVKHSTELKKVIGYIPAEVYFYENLKVIDLLKYSSDLKNVKDQKKIDYLVDAFELDTSKKFGNLSFGNKKKVSVIQALMHEPQILILDEPTNGLDPLVQKTLLELIKEENKKGTTVFFSSHTLSVVQKICNRIGIIKDGEMVKIESYESIKKKQIKKIYLEAEEIIKPNQFGNELFDDLKINKNVAEFYYKGNINQLFAELSHIKINDFSMSEPELEEIFMHFYENGGGKI